MSQVAPPPTPDLEKDTERGELAARRRRRMGAGGRSGTVLTGPRGLGDSPVYTGKTFLGE